MGKSLVRVLVPFFLPDEPVRHLDTVIDMCHGYDSALFVNQSLIDETPNLFIEVPGHTWIPGYINAYVHGEYDQVCKGLDVKTFLFLTDNDSQKPTARFAALQEAWYAGEVTTSTARPCRRAKYLGSPLGS